MSQPDDSDTPASKPNSLFEEQGLDMSIEWTRRGFPCKPYFDAATETFDNYCPCFMDDLKRGHLRCAALICNTDGEYSMIGCHQQKKKTSFSAKAWSKFLKSISSEGTRLVNLSNPHRLCDDCINSDMGMSYNGVLCENYDPDGACRRWQLHPACGFNQCGLCELQDAHDASDARVETATIFCRQCRPTAKVPDSSTKNSSKKRLQPDEGASCFPPDHPHRQQKTSHNNATMAPKAAMASDQFAKKARLPAPPKAAMWSGQAATDATAKANDDEEVTPYMRGEKFRIPERMLKKPTATGRQEQKNYAEASSSDSSEDDLPLAKRKVVMRHTARH